MPMGDGDRPGSDDGYAAHTYGRGFADVYDQWYPSDDSTTDAVARISALAGPGGTILELGVGTGRLAVPLAQRGHRVVGMDASTEMLDRLAANAAHLAAGSVEAARGDIGAPDAWPVGPFDAVVAAFNLVCNVVDPLRQAGLFATAHRVLAPGGTFVVETFVPAPVAERSRHLQVREVTEDSVILIASDTDPLAGIVTGQHIELRDGEAVRLRPWRLRLTTPAELDRWAVDAGFSVHHAWQGWGDPADSTAVPTTTRIGVYRRD